MNIRNTDYNIEHFIVEGLNRGLLENDIVRFYQDQSYNVFYSRDYVRYIHGEDDTNPILNIIKHNDPVKTLFSKYDSGYPDLLLIRGNYVKFVEIKLDGDRVRPNQVLFLEELSKLYPTSLVFFNNISNSIKDEEVIKVSAFSKVDKLILNQIELLTKVAKKSDFKPFWVVSKLYEQFGYKILNKSIISILAKSIEQPKDKVVWFIKENLDKEDAVLRTKQHETIKKLESKKKRQKKHLSKIKP